MKVLLIGGTGFIGSAAACRLADSEHDVHVVHRGNTSAMLPPSVRVSTVDRDDVLALTTFVASLEPDVTVDFVSYTADHASAVVTALGSCDSRLVTMSSADVYRNYDGLRRRHTKCADPTPLTEDAPLRERFFPYRGTMDAGSPWRNDYEKLHVERTVRDGRGHAATILRLAKVYGPGDPQDHVGSYWRRIVSGKGEVVLEVGQSHWRWTRAYVDDVAEAIATVVRDERSRGRTYNVGDANGLTEVEWIREVAVAGSRSVSFRGTSPEELPESDRAELAWGYDLELSTTAIRRELGFRELVGRSEGVRRTVAAFDTADAPE